MDELVVAYVSPGWPLSDYPNGIVAYLENLISGFDDEVWTYILAHKVKNNSQSNIVNLSEYKDEVFISRKINSLLFMANNQFLADKLVQRKRVDACARIIRGIAGLDKQPDIIEIEESFGIGDLLVNMTEISVVTRLHGPWFIHGPMMMLDKQYDYKQRIENEGRAIKVSHGITAPSLDVLNKTREYYDLALDDAVVIPNPVQPVMKSMQWWHHPENKPTILFVGRFDLHKGGDLAIDAFRIIANQNKDIEFLFVGPDRGIIIEGKKYSFYEYLDAFVPELMIKKRIHFLGHCNAEMVARYRRHSTVTMITSRYENFPMTLLEALSTGSPVVATAVGGIKEIIIDGFNGFLAEPESADSVAEKVMIFFNSLANMKITSKNAIEDSKKRFSPEVVAKQTIKFYHSIL